MGNSGARSSGPIGWPVPGCSGGWGGWGASARMLYQLRGISLSGRTIFVSATRRILSKRRRAAKDTAARGTNRNAPAGRRTNTQRSVCMILSLGDFLWSLLVIFFMVIYFMMLFQVIVDIFRRHDASGGKKALWLLFLLCVPLVGLLAYMITNSESMAERNVQSVKQSQAEFDSYVQTVAGSGGSAAEIAKAKELLDSGAINQSEFDALKAKALA